MYQKERKLQPRSLERAYRSVSMIVHAMACQPAKNAGALMAVNAISDAIPLIHGPLGCAALRKLNSFGVYSLCPRSPCTNLDELDLIYGAEAKLAKAIRETDERWHPALIVVIPTCPSDMIGDDMAAAVQMVEKDVGCRVVYSTGELIKGRPIGYHDVLCSLLDQLLPEGMEIHPMEDAVNLIAFPIHSASGKLTEMVEILGEMDIGVNKIFFGDTSLEDIFDLPRAALNITDLPLPWLDRMKERFGVPYYATSSLAYPTDPDEINPNGMENSARILLEIADLMGKKEKAVEVVERRKRRAREKLEEEKAGLQAIKVAVVGGLFFGMGMMLVKDMGMEASLLIYKTYGFENHGMARTAIRQMIQMDLEAAKAYGPTPAIIVNPSHEEEIKAIKETGTQIVIAATADMFRYHQQGICAFDSMDFYMNSLRTGFECPIDLARDLKMALARNAKKRPLLSMLEYDPYESSLLPNWVKLENVWRAVTEGADGGCIYG